MTIRTFADGKQIIHLELEVSDTVLPCPFCGSGAIELQNTHTPSYWIKCVACGAEVGDPGMDYGHRKNDMSGHRASKRAALAAWNRRVVHP